MKNLAIIILGLMSFCFSAAARDKYSVSLGASLGDHNWTVEPRFGYKITDNFSANMGIRYQRAYTRGPGGATERFVWKVEDHKSNILLPISVRGSLPIAKMSKTNSLEFFVEPGVLVQLFSADRFNVDYDGERGWYHEKWTEYHTKNYNWCYLFWSGQVGFEYKLDDVSLSVGYEINNQDFLKKRRGTRLHGANFEDYIAAPRKVYHNAFARMTVYF